ncbi:MAG: 23S rRNA pseudouridine synthase [Bacteroidetes bacterium]|nr:MAG: 23S rRNA pseudouridine synthase [Bacteroidota bacterium]
MLSQFKPEGGHSALGDLFDFPPDVYPVGRLDHDSEGLLLLTNDKKITPLLLDPKQKHKRIYWVQVEGMVSDKALDLLAQNVQINLDGKSYFTLPAKARRLLPGPEIPERIPPIRFRKNVPTSWIELCLREGKNRQVRKMTAAVGFPTLRLIRVQIEDLKLGEMKSGDVMELERDFVYRKLKLK